MKRCAICDYTMEYGSEYLGIPKSRTRRIKWNPTHSEFQCTTCYTEIKKQVWDKDLGEFNKFIEGDLVCEEEQVASYLSSMPKSGVPIE